MAYHRSKTSILSSLDKDYIEEGRRDIYKWGEKRCTRRKGIRGWAYAFKKRFIDKSILRSFLNNLTVSLLIQLILSGLFTYICQTLDLSMDVHIALFVSPIVFPLAFSINADFQRREHVLEDLALFKGGLIVLFFCHRDWHVPAGLSQEFLKAVTNKLKGLILNVKEYLLTEEEVKRSFILQVIYEDFSDISQMNEKMRVALPDSASLVQRLIHCHNLMFWAFERLRVIREYRSPRGIRSFTKVFIFVMPLLLSPYYVFVGKSSHNTWSPYYISLISTFVFGTLQGVQDVLDDPFDGISEDDVNLGSLEDWTAHSLLTNRTYTVGRFTVTASVQRKDETQPISVETRNISERTPSFKNRVNAPLRSILRRASHRPLVQDRPDVLSKVSEEDVDVLYPEMALQLQNVKKKKEFTGSATILPGFQIKEHPQDVESEDGSILGTPASLERSVSDLADVYARRRAYRKNVSFSQDLDDESNQNSPERMSESSLTANDSFPLLRNNSKLDKDDMSQPLEPDPDKFSADLLESFGKLQSVSGTERVVQAKSPTREGMPTSLAALFQPLPAQGQNDSSEQSVPSESAGSAVTDQPGANENEGNNSNSKPSRFTVVKLKNSASSNSIPTRAITTDNNIDKDKTSESRPSRFSVTPSSQPPSTTGSPRPSRFAVTPSTQTSAAISGTQSTPVGGVSSADNVKIQSPPENRFQVKSASTQVEDKHGETNLGLSSSEASFGETPSTNNQTNQKPSRFSITKSENQENMHDDSPMPLVDRTPKKRQSSFWDFSEDDSDDGHSPKTLGTKESRIGDVLDLPDGCRGEVYI